MKNLLEVCGGCNAKLGPDLLHLVLSGLKNTKRGDVLIGYESNDDAAVIQISENEGIVLTMDFFPAVVEDPYYFGQIAAANALSDIYAMGASPIAALNMVCFPENGDISVLKEILRGGADKVAEAAAALVGGHSIHDNRPKYGLAVIGKVALNKLWKNNTPKENDVLILTKPLGISLITGAARAAVIPENACDNAIHYMTQLNAKAAAILKHYPVHACTDVTGFSLTGHLLEMLGKDFSATLFLDAIPTLPYAKEAAEAFAFSAGGQRNRKHAEKFMPQLKNIPFYMQEILFDPQTSGGLLASVELHHAEEIVSQMRFEGVDAHIIGTIEAGNGFINTF